MSSNYWQTERQRIQYSNGKEITQKVSDYVNWWKLRAYNSDIPDDIPKLLMKTNRAPCYRKIALAILNNDHTLSSLGFSRSNKFYMELKIGTLI